MPASLSADGCIWGFCLYCRKAVHRFVGGQIWRTTDRNSECLDSPVKIHIPER